MTVPPVDRAAALAEGAPRIPRRVMVIALLAVAALGLGGSLLERAVSAAGLNPIDATTTTTTSPTNAELHASTASLLGITGLAPIPASGITLTDQAGRALTLRSLRGDVVVVSFFNADCKDDCPVIAAEIRHADADLGARRSGVVFLTINTDPLATGSIPPPIDVYPRTGAVAHTDIMYFVDPTGHLRIRATPVANETRSGTNSLPPVLVARSAAGIATYAVSLLGART